MNNINLYYHTGSSNHGCEAIVRGTHKILEGELKLFSFAPDEDVKYNLDKIVEIKEDSEVKIKKKSLKYYLSAIQYKFFNKTILATKFRRKLFFSNIKKGDISLSIGGDNYTYKGREQLADYNQLLHQKRSKTVLWGCSIDEEIIPEIVDDLNRYDLIVAREYMTYNALKKQAINTKIRICPDPAFLLDANEVQFPDNLSSENAVGINLSPLILKYGNEEMIMKNIEALFQYILKNTSFKIALIPHVVMTNNDDRDILNIFYDKFKHTNRISIIQDTITNNLKGYISKCRFFIGARTHATIAAYSTSVPTLAIGYSMKSKGIASDIFGTYENYVRSVQNFKEVNDLTNAFEWLVQNENNIKELYSEVMPNYKKQAFKGAEFIKEILNE